MILKRKRLFSFIFLSASLISFSALAAKDITQTRVRIIGTILEPTCTIVNPNIDVDLGTIIGKGLYIKKRSSSVPFVIQLEKCNVDFKNDVRVTFSGDESTAIDLQGYLAISPQSTASGIAIGIENANGQFLPLREESIRIPITSSNMDLHFRAFVAAEDNAIKNKTIVSGEFTAVANFVVEYE